MTLESVDCGVNELGKMRMMCLDGLGMMGQMVANRWRIGIYEQK